MAGYPKPGNSAEGDRSQSEQIRRVRSRRPPDREAIYTLGDDVTYDVELNSAHGWVQDGPPPQIVYYHSLRRCFWEGLLTWEGDADDIDATLVIADLPEELRPTDYQQYAMTFVIDGYPPYPTGSAIQFLITAGGVAVSADYFNGTELIDLHDGPLDITLNHINYRCVGL